MSTKPETTMSAEVEEMNVEVAIGSVLGWFADDTTLPRDIKVALTKLIKTSRKHLSCPQTTAQSVAALIAEGGETIWWCEVHEMQGNESGCPIRFTAKCQMVECLRFPIPVESAEANGESPEVPT